MKKRVFSIFCCVILMVTICSTSYAENVQTDNSFDGTSSLPITECEITETLLERLNAASDEDVIPITVRLTDAVELDKVEKLAIERAGVTVEELSAYDMQNDIKIDEEKELLRQKAIHEVMDRIATERTNILGEYYRKLNADFLYNIGIGDLEYVRASRLLPYIWGIQLTKAQINKLRDNNRVCYMDCFEQSSGEDLASVNDTRQIIGGNIAISSGHTGSGIRVGLVESGHPKLNKMGNDAACITKTNSGGDTDHATVTSGIIIKLAPSCSVFSRSAGNCVSAIEQCEYLIEEYSVNVVNVSCGTASNGKYNSISRAMDELVQNYKVPIVVAAGNDGHNGYINQLGLGANVIAVGSVHTNGTNPRAVGAFELADYSSCAEHIETINKPDVCAPGRVSIYSYVEWEGTSFAAPHVTGTIVQMLSRNASLNGRPETVKAALMASAFYNAGTDMSYVANTMASNQEGAGVIDSGFCFNVANYSQYTGYGVGGPGIHSVTVSCNDISRPFRIAATWYVTSSAENNTTNRINIDIYIYKNGQLVTSSRAAGNPSSILASTNYEIIQLEPSVIKTYGAGQYEVRISLNGSFSGMGVNNVGIAYGLRTQL